MKKIITFFVSFLVIFLTGFSNQTNAGIFGGDSTQIPYCQPGEPCGLGDGVDQVKNSGIQGLVTIGTGSEYVQRMVAYALSFLAIVAVILIIYAGFNLLISIGDEEKAKKSKTIIFFAILGLLIIFLAKPITTFVINILSSTPTP
ncbi:MAG: hypothetical protein PHV23_02065 [Candidatus Gracilibacteria bacterium]|nr:hypothetical protein [Candidatus Gracilibacteria bacterium]